jgi:hypothetical protein
MNNKAIKKEVVLDHPVLNLAQQAKTYDTKKGTKRPKGK